MTVWGAIQAGLWGLLAGGALVIGAWIGLAFRLPVKMTAIIMAFGAGVLISALSFDLMDEAFQTGGLAATAIGFVAGALLFTGGNFLVNRMGARHRKRSGDQQSKATENDGRGIAVGALLDGVPESIVIGLSLIGGGSISGVVVVAVFLSNLPEGLASAVGMKRAGRSSRFILGMWTLIALASGLSALAGYLLFGDAPPQAVAGVQAVAAGAMLAMIADTMMPEAFEDASDLAGLMTVAGFLSAFALTMMSR